MIFLSKTFMCGINVVILQRLMCGYCGILTKVKLFRMNNNGVNGVCGGLFTGSRDVCLGKSVCFGLAVLCGVVGSSFIAFPFQRLYSDSCLNVLS